ncbi:MAG: hypothetical protein LBC89_05035 [Bacteroidales bacterium]|nr:hypothetical protein [Bacteroidales bacterium]
MFVSTALFFVLFNCLASLVVEGFAVRLREMIFSSKELASLLIFMCAKHKKMTSQIELR